MPVIDFDHQSRFAGWYLFAIMHWPLDQIARDNFTVTVAAQLMQKAEDGIPRYAERQQQDLGVQVAAATGFPVEKVRAELASKTKPRVAAAISSVLGEIENNLFRPSGGFGRVAAAGGTDAIEKSARTEGRIYGAACGGNLTDNVRLATHHQDITASINRATYIMVERAKKHGRTSPAERARKTMWTTWGGIAPLWAAVALHETVMRARGARQSSWHDPAFRQEMISISLWLADFVVKFKPVGAKEPLLSENKVIRLNCGLEAVEPEIPPLTDEELAWARAYKAPQPAA